MGEQVRVGIQEMRDMAWLTISVEPGVLTELWEMFLRHKSDFGIEGELHAVQQWVYLDLATGKLVYYDHDDEFVVSPEREGCQLVARWRVLEKPKTDLLPAYYDFDTWLLDPNDGYRTTLTKLNLNLDTDGVLISALFDHKVGGRVRNFMLTDKDQERDLYEYGHSMSATGIEAVKAQFEQLLEGFRILLDGE